jgi:hypothetical protein
MRRQEDGQALGRTTSTPAGLERSSSSQLGSLIGMGFTLERANEALRSTGTAAARAGRAAAIL